MGRKFSFVAALWWVLGCFVLGLCLFLFANRDGGVSDRENRTLASFPACNAGAILSGEFMTGFEAFLTDNFFARDAVIDMTDGMTGAFSRMTQEDEYVLDDTEARIALLDADVPEDAGASDADADAPAGEAEPEEDIEPEEEAPPEEDTDDAEDTPKVNTFCLRKVAGGNKHIYSYSQKNIARLADNLNTYRAALPADGTVHFAQAPVSAQAKRWLTQTEVYDGWVSTVEPSVQALVNEGVYVHNMPEILEKHMAAGEKTYFYTDHHWAALGAYYVCAEMMRVQGYPVMPYDEYEYKINQTSKAYKGQTDSVEMLRALEPVRSLVVQNRTEEKEYSLMNYKSTTYTGFMNNSRRPWRRIVTGYHTGRKALVIGDSFSNAFAPYLLPYYDEVHMTDVRHNYYKKAQAGGNVSELIAYYGIDDVYIVVSTANGINSKTCLMYLRQYFEE